MEAPETKPMSTATDLNDAEQVLMNGQDTTEDSAGLRADPSVRPDSTCSVASKSNGERNAREGSAQESKG